MRKTLILPFTIWGIAGTFPNRQKSQPFIITTRDIDREVADTARLIGYAVNMALQHISVEEIDLYLS